MWLTNRALQPAPRSEYLNRADCTTYVVLFLCCAVLVLPQANAHVRGYVVLHELLAKNSSEGAGIGYQRTAGYG